MNEFLKRGRKYNPELLIHSLVEEGKASVINMESSKITTRGQGLGDDGDKKQGIGYEENLKPAKIYVGDAREGTFEQLIRPMLKGHSVHPQLHREG
ncbi:hypothetical protein [Paenibacillus sp. 1A_MP2]|uniref:hypothetical protein n=1 Tax=Paenibacillus sp. 1A_MP2 TaxID=3457495 RepID=UPI003FCECAE7